MQLEYLYTNDAWNHVKYNLTIKSDGDVYYKNFITGKEKKVCKLTNKTTYNLFANAEQIKKEPYLVNSGRAYDAGTGNFYLTRKNEEQILLHSDGNHQLQSTDQKVIYVISLMKQIIKAISHYL